jgi:hypothetical protein
MGIGHGVALLASKRAEKALKALGEHFRQDLFGHNLNLLLQGLQTFVSIPDEVRQACARLTATTFQRATPMLLTECAR